MRAVAVALAAVLAPVIAIGCGDEPAVAPDAAPGGGAPSIAGTPVSAFEGTTCATDAVIELSRQIAEEVNCMLPGQLVRFEAGAVPGGRIELTGSAVLPYLGEAARADLLAAAGDNGGVVLRINSAFRTVVQQYLLRRWFELGRCGITAAAEPGDSNHESGRALDVDNYGPWRAALGRHGWDQSVPGDPVHFDHLATPDIRGADVLAFQRLWNRNAPDDPLAEDGSYGPATAARIQRAPAEGFGLGASCAARLVIERRAGGATERGD